jgi:SPP1 family predicted phage head-tail adaptor
VIPAGERDKYIGIQAPTKTRGSDGSESITYSTIGYAWAKITPLTGREYYNAKQVNSEITHEIVMPYRSVFRMDYRISYKGRYFNIISGIDFAERGEELVLKCKEVTL